MMSVSEYVLTRRRMELFVRDVNDVTNTLGKKCDVLVAVNYSICYFHSRTRLITVRAIN